MLYQKPSPRLASTPQEGRGEEFQIPIFEFNMPFWFYHLVPSSVTCLIML